MALAFLPTSVPCGDRGAQHVARREMGDGVLLVDALGLRAFAGRRRAEENDDHVPARTLEASLLDQAFVLVREQMAVHLGDGVHRHR